MNDGPGRREKVKGWTRPSVRDLKPYYKAPTAGDPLRLDQNTNLFGNNPALAKLDPTACDLTQYPSRDADSFLAALADFHGLPPECFAACNGGDEALDMLVKAFGEPKAALATPTPSYSLYPFQARIAGLKLVQVPLRAAFSQLDIDGLLAAKARITIVATPNNPTGNRFTGSDVERLLEESDGVVVVDEAYVEFAGLKHSLLPRVESYDNLVVLRTLSKAYALAGLRVGYLAANRDLMERLRAVKPPFNVGVLAERLATMALDEQEWVDFGVKCVREERPRMADKLRKAGLRPLPSDANFILCETPMDPGQLLLELRKRGILARTFPAEASLQRHIRFTVGKPEHTDHLAEVVGSVLGSGPR